jgi:hypothetical protein
MATLRSEFLSVHPATKLWWEQREQCQRCAHVDKRLEGHKELTEVLRCKVTPVTVGRQPWAYCIDARAKGRECGPEAKLFKETDDN